MELPKENVVVVFGINISYEFFRKLLIVFKMILIYNIRFREYHRVSYGIKQIVFGIIYRSIISFLLYHGNFCSVYRKLCDIVIFLYEELFQIISNSCLSNAFDLFIKIVAVRFRNITHSATARRAPKRYLKRRPTNIWLSSNFSKILYYNSHFCIYENNK